MKKFALVATLLGSTTLLTACPGVSSPAVVYTQPASIQGTVKNWTSGAGTVSTLEGTTTLSTAPLAANGTFALTLPSAAALAPYLTATSSADFTGIAGCSGALTVSDPAAQSYFVSTLQATAAGTTKSIISATSTTSTSGSTVSVTLDGRGWIYTDRPLRLGGSATCTSSESGRSITVNYSANAQLSAGWNILRTAGSGTFTQTAATINLMLSNVVDGPTSWTESTTPVSTASLASPTSSFQRHTRDLLRLMPLR